MLRPILLVSLMALPSIAAAQDQQAETGQPPQRVRSVTIARGQACPKGTGNEVVVCSTLDEPYRIPKQLRDDGPIPSANQSWVNRTDADEQTARVAGGLPDTCSPVGTGGQSGCALQQNQQWAAEKRAQRAAAQDIP